MSLRCSFAASFAMIGEIDIMNSFRTYVAPTLPGYARFLWFRACRMNDLGAKTGSREPSGPAKGYQIVSYSGLRVSFPLDSAAIPPQSPGLRGSGYRYPGARDDFGRSFPKPCVVAISGSGRDCPTIRPPARSTRETQQDACNADSRAGRRTYKWSPACHRGKSQQMN